MSEKLLVSQPSNRSVSKLGYQQIHWFRIWQLMVFKVCQSLFPMLRNVTIRCKLLHTCMHTILNIVKVFIYTWGKFNTHVFCLTRENTYLTTRLVNSHFYSMFSIFLWNQLNSDGSVFVNFGRTPNTLYILFLNNSYKPIHRNLWNICNQRKLREITCRINTLMFHDSIYLFDFWFEFSEKGRGFSRSTHT